MILLFSQASVVEVINSLNSFSKYSGLKPNASKCEIAGIGVLNGVNVALCGMKSIDLCKDSVKILGTYYSYDKELEQDKNFVEHICKIQDVLKTWRMRQLSIEGRITVFKTLATSKIIHLAMTTSIHKTTINQRKFRKILFGMVKNLKLNMKPFVEIMKVEV